MSLLINVWEVPSYILNMETSCSLIDCLTAFREVLSENRLQPVPGPSQSIIRSKSFILCYVTCVMEKVLPFKLRKKWSLAESFHSKVTASKDLYWGLIASWSVMWSQVRESLEAYQNIFFCPILWFCCHSIRMLLLLQVSCHTAHVVTDYMQFFVLQCAFACFFHKCAHKITMLRSG